MNILVPSCPARLTITQTMVEDFIINPCLGAKIIMGEDQDAFQRARLKICWWTPFVIDSSGFSSAKSRNMVLVSVLRSLLLPEHVSLVYYQNFQAAKDIYGRFFSEMAARSPLFRAQLGRPKIKGVDTMRNVEDAKSLNKQPSTWIWDFRNGSRIMAPAPGFSQDAKNQAGKRSNDLYIDEWTKVEAGGTEGIDDQLVGRTTQASWNKHHPIYCNHHLFTATAEDVMHPAFTRYSGFMQEIRHGNPDYALIAFSYKDYSDLPHTL
jgi:hypothetical protein